MSATFSGMAAPTLSAPAAMATTTVGSTLTIAYDDRSSTTYKLAYQPFFVTGDQLPDGKGGRVVVKGKSGNAPLRTQAGVYCNVRPYGCITVVRCMPCLPYSQDKKKFTVDAKTGIVHSEMFPLLEREGPNPAELFQIWLNLPRANKLAPPHFSMLWNDRIPRAAVVDSAGKTTKVTVIAGKLGATLRG